MKIRNGFVSNSSSSSFVVKGYVLPYRELTMEEQKQIMDKYNYDYKEDIKRWAKEEFDQQINDPDTINETWYEFVWSTLKDSGVYYATDEENGAPKNSTLIGQLLVDTGSDSYYIPGTIIDTEDSEILQEIRKSFNISDDEKIKVVIGARCC